MGPAPGIWEFVGKIAVGVFIVSVVLSMFAKGKWRLLLFGWAASLVLVVLALAVLERD
jgi:hypothetical protein